MASSWRAIAAASMDEMFFGDQDAVPDKVMNKMLKQRGMKTRDDGADTATLADKDWAAS